MSQAGIKEERALKIRVAVGADFVEAEGAPEFCAMAVQQFRIGRARYHAVLEQRLLAEARSLADAARQRRINELMSELRAVRGTP